MRIRSTDAVSRSDDTGNDVLEASSRVLDLSAPGRVEHFHPGSTFTPEGVDRATESVDASWVSVAPWPTHPMAILCETEVRLSEGDSDETQGLALQHVFDCPDVEPVAGWPVRRNRVLVIPGGVLVLRQEGLFLFDFGMDSAHVWGAPFELGESLPG